MCECGMEEGRERRRVENTCMLADVHDGSYVTLHSACCVEKSLCLNCHSYRTIIQGVIFFSLN